MTPRQETFFSSTVDGRKIEVVKTYDSAFAREAFAQMDDVALDHLAVSLDISSNYEDGDVPARTSIEYSDFIWDEMVDSAREDGNLSSYFIVTESRPPMEKELFVSHDWPTAEAYVRRISDGALVSETH